MAILLIPVGLLLLAIGLKGILAMLGITSGGSGPHFYCGNSPCDHELGQHNSAGCRRCGCPEYISALDLQWQAYLKRTYG